jgi:hypothetical protein
MTLSPPTEVWERLWAAVASHDPDGLPAGVDASSSATTDACHERLAGHGRAAAGRAPRHMARGWRGAADPVLLAHVAVLVRSMI